MSRTSAQRKADQRAKDDARAKAAGWRDADEFLTAVRNGQVRLPRKPAGFVAIRAAYPPRKKTNG